MLDRLEGTREIVGPMSQLHRKELETEGAARKLGLADEQPRDVPSGLGQAGDIAAGNGVVVDGNHDDGNGRRRLTGRSQPWLGADDDDHVKVEADQLREDASEGLGLGLIVATLQGEVPALVVSERSEPVEETPNQVGGSPRAAGDIPYPNAGGGPSRTGEERQRGEATSQSTNKHPPIHH